MSSTVTKENPKAKQSGSNKKNTKQIWDDRLLIKAYEKAISQRVAEQEDMSENGANENETSGVNATNDTDVDDSDKTYKIGDIVRATYDVDGVDYEAEIIAIDIENEECLVRYIGYENEQIVGMADLVDSWGIDERNKQKKAAAEEQCDESGTDAESEPNIELFRKGETEGKLPIPPMPPIPPMLAQSLDQESEDFSAMLMAWYMSGYYTGFYQGRRSARQEQPKKLPKKSTQKRK